jgi:sugar phosphate isomerase/epimerase
MHEKDPGTRAAQLDEGRRFIDLAHALEVKYVRMFGDRMPEGEPRQDVMKRVVEGFQQMAAHATSAGVIVLMESHGDFTKSRDLVAIERAVKSQAFALLWDAHHTFVAGEAPADTYAAIGRLVRHTHLKDSKADGTGRRYVLTGTGEVPVKAQVSVLAAGGYKGYYSFEWEKKWHPEIEDPEVAFPHYARTVGEYLAEAGVMPT